MARRTPRFKRLLPAFLAVVALFSVPPVAQLGPAGATSTDYDLVVSEGTKDATPTRLEGETVSGTIWVTATKPSSASVKHVVFFIDPTKGSSHHNTDKTEPYQLAEGQGFDTTRLTDGTHSIKAVYKLTNGNTKKVTSSFTVANAGTTGGTTSEPATTTSTTSSTYDLVVSEGTKDATPTRLEGETVSGTIWVTATKPSSASVKHVVFFIDPTKGSSHHNTDTSEPYQLAEGQGYDTTRLTDGTHSIKAVYKLTNGNTKKVTSSFTVANAGATDPGTTDPSTTDPGTTDPGTTDPGISTLFVTSARLAEWRVRAENGPYRVGGDVSLNSPGDWSRIVDEKNTFMSNPSAVRWSGPAGWRNITSTGCIPDADAGGEAEWMTLPETLSSAALYAAVKQDHQVATAVATELAAQVNHQDTKFADRNRYCLDSGPRSDNVILTFMGDWLAGELVAYDLLQAYEADTGTSVLSDSQEQAFQSWARSFAVWVHHHVDRDLSQLFANRSAGDYTLTKTATSTPSHSQRLYDGGQVPWKVSIKYNNRNARAMRGAGLAVAVARDTTMIAENERYWRELVMFGVFPEGALSDFERWESTSATKGWKYATEMLAPMATVAAAFASLGDTELYTFSTTAGSDQTAGLHWTGSPKSLARAINDVFRYVAKHENRKAGGNVIHPSTVWVHELGTIQANAFYKDDYVRRTYLRSNTDAYPSKPSRGKFNPWRGDSGIYPGALFMFGQMEAIG